MITFLTSILSAVTALAENVDVDTPALVALGELEEDLKISYTHKSFEPFLTVDIHCKAFVVGFISTVFTLLPFIVAYAGKNQVSLDPSNVVIGLAKVGGLGGVCYALINRGNPLAREEFDRVSEFIHPYIPMIVGSMGRGAYEPVFQEMQKHLGTSTSTPPFAGYTSGYSSARPNPSNPSKYSSERSWLADNNKTPNMPSRTIETHVPAASPSGYAAKVVHEPPLIQVKEPDIGLTVCLTAYHPPNDPQTVEVDIDDMNPIEDMDRKQRSKQDDFEFDRDALYDFDTP